MDCPQCHSPIPPGALACPNCGWLINRAALEQLAAEAIAYEPHDPMRAAEIWRECLPLLPADSQQHAMVQQRIQMLISGMGPQLQRPMRARPIPRDDTFGVAVMKTFGSMILSIAVYSYLMGWAFATGFVLLTLVHEMGHVIANRIYGIKASPPIFIPFLGAVINLRQAPPNAKVEAIVGIGGPVLGTIGAFAVYFYWLHVGIDGPLKTLPLELAFYGFLLNLFNLMPVPPLDGGRVMAAVSPWVWMLGILALAGMVVYDYTHGHLSPIMLLVLFYAFPRVWRTLTTGERHGPYYQISRISSWTIGISYLILLAVLVYGFFVAKQQLGIHGWI